MTKMNFFVTPYLYVVRGEFANELTDETVKQYYRKLLEDEVFDGFSQIEAEKDEDKPKTKMVVSSKDNQFRVTITNADLELVVTNPLDEPPTKFAYSWLDLRNFIKRVNDKSDNALSKLKSVLLLRDVVVLTKDEPQLVAKKIFTDSLAQDAFGYSATFMSHTDDSSLEHEHVHAYWTIDNGYVSAMRDGSFKELTDRLNSYILHKEFKYDSHDEDNMELAVEEVYVFLEKYYRQADKDLTSIARQLGFSEAGR